MKRVVIIILLILLFFSGRFIYNDLKIISGTDELIKTAQAVLPISQDKITSISYAGIYGNNDEALVWFISDDGYGGHDYWVIKCEVVGKNEYKLIEWSRPKVYAKDIVSTLWNTDNIFLINNENCVAIQYRNDQEIVVFKDTIKEGSYPYLYELRHISAKVDFIDYNGKHFFETTVGYAK